VPGVQTIMPSTPLPTITDTVFLDATTQPGFFDGETPLIQLDGTLAGAGTDGLTLSTNSAFVQGLAINRFSGDGLVVNGTGNFVALNVIGASPTTTDPTVVDRPGLAPRPNGGDGIVVRGDNNLILNSVIAFNGGNGITVLSGVRNDVALNAIFGNLKLGIDLGGDGRTRNDRTDADPGPNDLLNYPVLNTVITSGQGTFVFGSIQTAANRKVSITLYASPTADGQGRTVLTPASITVLTDDSGAATFTANFPTTKARGYITAVAASNPTDQDQFPDVSEFSPPVAVPGTVPPRVSDVYVNGGAWSETFRQYVGNSDRGLTAFGAQLPAQNTTPAAVPWIGVDRISLRFEQQIALANATFTLTGVKRVNYPIGQFSYDQSARVATWALTTPIVAGDRLTLTLDGAVAAFDGVPLDGDYNGTGGGAYRRTFNILPGDVDRTGNVVNAGDLVVVRNHVGQNASADGTATSNYDPFIDLNTDATINASDLVLVRNRVGQTSIAALFSATRVTPASRDGALRRLQADGVLD
jgi:hypothetical protein